MPLSKSESNHLRNDYENLVYFFPPEKQHLFIEKKEAIIQYCIANDIRLYNIVQLKSMEAASLLQRLLSYFLAPNSRRNHNNKAEWIDEFNLALALVSDQLVEMHDSARATLGEEYCKNGSIPLSSLLNQQDMVALLNVDEYSSEDLLTTEPFSLSEISAEQFARIQAMLGSEENSEREFFLPATHDGHWFYLHRKDGAWSVQDSQPLVESSFTPRQESILTLSQRFLASLHNGQDYGELIYQTTAKQVTTYDCGTHVINAYRARVDNDYEEMSHREIIEEVLHIQLPEEDTFTIEDDSDFDLDEDAFAYLPVEDEPVRQIESPKVHLKLNKVDQVLEATVSCQRSIDKVDQYRENLLELVHAVVAKGLFAKIDKPRIELDKLNTAEADEETDEEFATRLQEAEFRSAGLKK